MVKSVFPAAAAAFIAIAGARAADMPRKAEPLQYVRICTLYGAGFYSLPGTDICIKQGAYVRLQPYFNMGSLNATFGPFITPAAAQSSRLMNAPNDTLWRVRAVYTLDARTQTEYGTLRAYALIGSSDSWPANSSGGNVATLYATRGFIQFAGFTLGKATSFYAIFSTPENSYFSLWSSDTGETGDIVAAYTALFGNGFSATLAAEDPRKNVVVNTSITTPTVNPFVVGAVPTADQANIRWPDVVANLRVDQAWGSFQIMGALHDNSPGFWVPSLGVTCNVTASGGTLTGQMACGHPDDKLGLALGAGGIFRIPMPGGLTDVASFQVNYSQGASRYVVYTQPGAGSPALFGGTGLAVCPTATVPANANGLNVPICLGSLGVGYWSDGIYGNPGALPGYDGSVHNTQVWGVNAAWDHLWTANLKTSVYGTFIHVDYDATATALLAIPLCGPLGAPPGAINGLNNCNPGFSFWQLGSRTQWNILPFFHVGVDVMYQKLETAFTGTGFFTAATGLPRPSGNYQIKDQDTVSFMGRTHFDILP